MLELLILYSLNKSELTLYALRKFISEHFGEISFPSHGALHPALKRLKDKGVVELRKKISDGGKLYSYYSVNKNFINYFNTKFADIPVSKNESTDSFLSEIRVRIIVSDIADSQIISQMKQKAEIMLSYYTDLIIKKMENSYLELNDVQKKIISGYKNELEEIKILLEKI